MQPQEVMNFPTSSEIELYRYFAAAAVGGGGGGGGIGVPNDVVVGLNNNYGGFGRSGNNNNNHNGNYSSSCNSSFYPGSSGIMNETTTDSKAIAASRILHKEAEKRRRERINSHLDRLRSLLPCTSKTDKATLLSKVVQRVLELKRQTSDLIDLDNLVIPSQNDEFSVSYDDDDNNADNNNNDNNNTKQLILKATLCCEDRPDLFTDLNQVLSSLRLKTIRAEISSLGGRIQGVLVVSASSNECAVFLRDALKEIVHGSGSSDDRLKRRRRVFDPSC